MKWSLRVARVVTFLCVVLSFVLLNAWAWALGDEETRWGVAFMSTVIGALFAWLIWMVLTEAGRR